MKENKYDDNRFFEQYSSMSRSIDGLKGAGEWHALRSILPPMKGKRLLDMGCGYGWHCQYAIEQGAERAVGIDLSTKMIEKAQTINPNQRIDYRVMSVEDFDYQSETFDIVLSSLTFHYIQSFDTICRNVRQSLSEGGEFIFSVEHPIFTAQGKQDWHRNAEGEILHWPVDSYFDEGLRQTTFLGEQVMKYHKTLTTYIQTLLNNGFAIRHLIEPQPEELLLQTVEGMQNELRRPMMLLIGTQKVKQQKNEK